MWGPYNLTRTVQTNPKKTFQTPKNVSGFSRWHLPRLQEKRLVRTHPKNSSVLKCFTRWFNSWPFYPRSLEVTNNLGRGHSTVPKKATKHCQVGHVEQPCKATSNVQWKKVWKIAPMVVETSLAVTMFSTFMMFFGEVILLVCCIMVDYIYFTILCAACHKIEKNPQTLNSPWIFLHKRRISFRTHWEALNL